MKARSLFFLPVLLLVSSLLLGSHPLTLVEWTAFASADSYEVQVKNLGGTVVAGPVANPDTDVVLGELMSGQAAGSYQLEIRAKSGEFFTAWSAPASFSWVLEIPGTVTGIVFTD